MLYQVMSPLTAPELYAADLHNMARACLDGRLIFFLGAGFNLADRPKCLRNDCERKQLPCSAEDCDLRSYLPSGKELSEHLAQQFSAFRFSNSTDLLKVSQTIDLQGNRRYLNRELDKLFADPRVSPTSIHKFLASICCRPAPSAEDEERPYPLIVTTNYDSLVEQELTCDILYYVPEQGGCFYRKSPGEDPVPIPIATANVDAYPYLSQRPTLLKIHGNAPAPGTKISADPADRREAYVITEDNYLDYLAGRPIEQLIPNPILNRLRRKEILFLGYSLGDWNVRVFLLRFRQTTTHTDLLQSYLGRSQHWAVSLRWPEKSGDRSPYTGITLLEMDLAAFRGCFKRALASLNPAFSEGIVD
jgi:hypothetical protein